MGKWIAEDLGALSGRYAHIARAVESHGVPPFLTHKAELRTLISLIIQQQVSVGAARSINQKFDAMFPDANPDLILSANDADLRSVGLSGQKVKYIRDLIQHVVDGRLDIAALKKLDESEIETKLTAVKGIGRWTAENYMLFALQRRNVWPAHDLALQEGMRKLKKLSERPSAKLMDVLGARYAPHRSAMALLGWHLHEGTKGLIF
jgi:DNA-3-methyladenine glycosylase II